MGRESQQEIDNLATDLVNFLRFRQGIRQSPRSIVLEEPGLTIPISDRPESEEITIFYPPSKDFKTVASGNVHVDFYEGSVTIDGKSTDNLSSSLRNTSKKAIYSLYVRISRPCVLRVNEIGERRIESDFKIIGSPIKTIDIVEASSAGEFKFSILAATNPIAGFLDIAKTEIKPSSRGSIFNTALPAAETNFLSNSILINEDGTMRIGLQLTIAGILRAVITRGGTIKTVNLNSNSNLTANAAYTFDIPVKSGDAINFRYSTTTGTIDYCEIQFGGL